MTKHYFKFISAVHLLLFKDGKVLLSRRFNTGYEDGNYGVPAGHIDGNERATTAMAREAREEAGIGIDEENLRMIHVMHRISPGTHPSGSDERIDFFFTATEWMGEPTNMEADKCDDLRWFGMNELPQNVIPYVRAAIEDYGEQIVFSEYGWG